jgi:cell division protein ZapA (FtsZ GTPase activity inhibitor)
MNTLTIDILGRTYTLSVNEREKVAVTQAAEELKERLAVLRSRYQVQDPIDLLAMSALNLLAEAKSEGKKRVETQYQMNEPSQDSESLDVIIEKMDRLIGLCKNQETVR